MGMAALAESQTIKISSKRQITIPAKIYEEGGFGEYALRTWTEQGLLLQPLNVDDEDITVDVLRHLIEQGFEGEELIEEYRKVKPRVVSVAAKLKEAEQDVREGRVGPAGEMQERMRKKYGLCGQ